MDPEFANICHHIRFHLQGTLLEKKKKKFPYLLNTFSRMFGVFQRAIIIIMETLKHISAHFVEEEINYY